jgi:two-component system OmpR family sensor kinase
MSFHTRVAIAVGGLTAVALGGAFYGVAAAFNGLQRRQLDASLLSIAALEAIEAPHNDFRFSTGLEPAANDIGPLTTYGVISDGDRIIAATTPFDLHPPADGVRRMPLGKAFDFEHETVNMRGVNVAIPGNPGLRLLVATSREDLDGDEAFLFLAMLTAFAVSVAWASLIAYWMSGRLIRDHQAIADVARRVAAGDLSARADVRSRDPEIIQLGVDMNEMVQRLGDLLSTQQKFIAHAAHELRSPLAALSVELQQAHRKERDVDEYKRAIRSALAATRRLTGLAEDLLVLARVTSDASAAKENIGIDTILDAALEIVEPLASSRSVRIARASFGSGCIADHRGDTVRLLRNLLENAIRFSPPGGTVRVDVTCDALMARLSIADHGPGVEAEEREQIFLPFYRGRNGASSEGTGLGLGIAREIARSYGGDIVVDPSTSEGARFIVSLPLAQPAS